MKKILAGLVILLGSSLWAERPGGYGPKKLIPQWIDPRKSPAAPLFGSQFSESDMSELARYMEGFRPRGSKVVRLQVLNTEEGPVVQGLRAIEARDLPPGKSVTIWGYRGRGKSTKKSLTRIGIRQATVEDGRPVVLIARRYDATVTTQGWVRDFRGKSTLRGLGSTRVLFSPLSANPWDAQVQAAVSLREPLAYALWVLRSRALRAPLIR